MKGPRIIILIIHFHCPGCPSSSNDMASRFLWHELQSHSLYFCVLSPWSDPHLHSQMTAVLQFLDVSTPCCFQTSLPKRLLASAYQIPLWGLKQPSTACGVTWKFFCLPQCDPSQPGLRLLSSTWFIPTSVALVLLVHPMPTDLVEPFLPYQDPIICLFVLVFSF